MQLCVGTGWKEDANVTLSNDICILHVTNIWRCKIHSLTGIFNCVHMVEDLTLTFTKQFDERKPISIVTFDLNFTNTANRNLINVICIALCGLKYRTGTPEYKPSRILILVWAAVTPWVKSSFKLDNFDPPNTTLESVFASRHLERPKITSAAKIQWEITELFIGCLKKTSQLPLT